MIDWITTSTMLAQAAAPSPNVQVLSVWDFIVKGGIVMIPIGLCSLAALTVTIERIVTLRQSRVIPSGFAESLEGTLRGDPANRAAAVEHCARNGSPAAELYAAALRRLDEPIELLEKHIEQAGQRTVLGLRRNLRVLALVASIAPLLGLLGTIFGMIDAFQTVATSAEALGKTELLARGIYEAMITTAAGLIVAIPTVVAHHWISARIDRLVGVMDAMVVDFVEKFARPSVVRKASTRGSGFAPQPVEAGASHTAAVQPAVVGG